MDIADCVIWLPNSYTDLERAQKFLEGECEDLKMSCWSSAGRQCRTIVFWLSNSYMDIMRTLIFLKRECEDPKFALLNSYTDTARAQNFFRVTSRKPQAVYFQLGCMPTSRLVFFTKSKSQVDIGRRVSLVTKSAVCIFFKVTLSWAKRLKRSSSGLPLKDIRGKAQDWTLPNTSDHMLIVLHWRRCLSNSPSISTNSSDIVLAAL